MVLGKSTRSYLLKTHHPLHAGHFPNEDLGALLFLDMALPKRIPLLWPTGGVATHFLEELRTENLISDRKLIYVDSTPCHYRARRVYFFRSSREWNEGPWITWLTQRLVQQQVLPVLARRSNQSAINDAKMRVVVLQRPPDRKSRVLENHDELMARLREWLPENEGFTIDSFIPGPGHGNPMWRTAERVYQSCLIIGPHGGHMPNLMFMRPGCWVLEIGFIDKNFKLPADFYCFARNLGLTYWMSIGDGAYDTPLRANLDDIRDIVAAYRREALADS